MPFFTRSQHNNESVGGNYYVVPELVLMIVLKPYCKVFERRQQCFCYAFVFLGFLFLNVVFFCKIVSFAHTFSLLVVCCQSRWW